MTHPNMRVFRIAMGLAALISIVAIALYLLAGRVDKPDNKTFVCPTPNPNRAGWGGDSLVVLSDGSTLIFNPCAERDTK